ncbi:MAG: DUF6760 family protein [Cyanobacteria bacterium P01_F01_bin.86]
MAQLTQEIAFIAFYFHWSRQEILSLEHQERHRWVAAINQLLAQET